MSLWEEVNLESIKNDLFHSNHSHICFFIGSFVSVGYPSNCLSVEEVRNELVLKQLLKSLKNDDERNIIKNFLCDKISSKPLQEVPFEQFMGCLHEANPKIAERIIRIANGSREQNDNHLAIKGLCEYLLRLKHIKTISVLTTNYDICLDLALKNLPYQEIKENQTSTGIPAYEYIMEDSKRLYYLKLHGCIEKPNSLVFTLDKMRELISKNDWYQELINWLKERDGLPTVALSIGYGFGDADLYEFLQTFLDNAVLYRNERLDFKEDESLSGRGFLRNEMFTNLGLRNEAGKTASPLKLFRSALIRSSNKSPSPSLVIDLFNTIPGISKNASLPEKRTIEDFRIKDAIDALGAFQEQETALFIARLSHACELSLGRELFRNRCLLQNISDADRVEMGKAYFNTFGDTGEFKEAIDACIFLINESCNYNIKLISYGYKSFALTIGPRKLTPFIRAWTNLFINGKLIKKKCLSIEARRFFNHFAICFQMKFIEALLQGCSIGKYLARRLVQRQENVLSSSIENLQLHSDIMEILTRLLLLAGDSGKAKKVASQIKILSGLAGRISNAAQADRLLGWVYSSEAGPENRIEAIKCFSRGLSRALKSTDLSLRPKLAANLLRVIWAEKINDNGYNDNDNVTEAMLEEACAILHNNLDSKKFGDMNIKDIPGILFDREDIRVAANRITKYTLSLFDSPKSLIKEIVSLSNINRHPIYHPGIKSKSLYWE